MGGCGVPALGRHNRVAHKGHTRAEPDARVRRPLSPRDKIVRVGPMQKMPCRDVLETSRSAVAGFPTQLFHQVYQFMFENPLQCLQAVVAVQPTDPDTPVPIAESVEQQVTGYGDLVAHIAGPRQETRRLAARISHTRRQPESDSSSVQGPEAEAGEESLVIGTEQKFEITAMNRGEVRLPDVSRMRQNTLVNLVDVLSDQFVRQPEGKYRFGQRTPG